MKKITVIITAAVFAALLSLTASAALRPEIAEAVGQSPHLVHVSYDEVRFLDADGAEHGYIICGADEGKILTPSFGGDAEVASIVFWGWASADGSPIKGFSYSVDGGGSMTDGSYKFATEQAVIDAGPGEYDSRFKVAVPATEGENKITVFVDYEDGTSEPIWIADVNVVKTAPQPEPPSTADAAVMLAAAAACAAFAGAVFAKKIRV